MELLVTVVLSLAGLMVLVRLFASNVYDILIVKMTSKWYKAVLSRIEPSSRVLDIGIGTATALLANKETMIEKKLIVVGVDYDQKYINFAQSKIKENNLGQYLSVHCKSIFDDDLGKVIKAEDKYDCAYFSGSWTLMPNPVQALHIASSFVKDDGKVYVTQTFQRAATPFLGTLKPLLKYITTIDFGELHYENDLEKYLKQAEEPVNGISLVIEENMVVPGSIDNQYQSAKLLVFKKVKK